MYTYRNHNNYNYKSQYESGFSDMTMYGMTMYGMTINGMTGIFCFIDGIWICYKT